jgi:hypothetical protein
MLPNRPGEIAISADAPARRRIPALTATFLTLLYAVGYLVWERIDWGTPTIRNLVSNVAFMPLNLAVVTLTGLASRLSDEQQQHEAQDQAGRDGELGTARPSPRIRHGPPLAGAVPGGSPASDARATCAR